MLFETEGSSAASSYADHDEIENFVDRCSICFYEQLDLCLDGCKDQFCHGCFQRFFLLLQKIYRRILIKHKIIDILWML